MACTPALFASLVLLMVTAKKKEKEALKDQSK